MIVHVLFNSPSSLPCSSILRGGEPRIWLSLHNRPQASAMSASKAILIVAISYTVIAANDPHFFA